METLTIGQLAKRVGMRTSALRFYQEQELLQPAGRTEAGYRIYTPEAEQTLRFIQRAQRLGFSLSDIRTLLSGWREKDLSGEDIIQTAEDRYLTIERQVTQLLVIQHELELFLEDMRQRAESQADPSGDSLFDRLIERVCANPLIQPAAPTLESLIEHTGCNLTSSEGQKLLDDLRGQHVHIWQEDDGYNILVVSDEARVLSAMEALSQFEMECMVHTHQPLELILGDEGYILHARGENAFFYARLFLALQREVDN
jgi:MerR family copper efflux transcriptional regulator